MGKRGPQPTPTPLKILKGNPGKREIPKDEPKPNPVAPKPPAWLNKEAKRVWKQLAPKLEAIGCLAEVDWPDFASLCLAVSELREARKILDLEGPVMTIKTERGEYKQQRPEVGIAHKAMDLIIKLSSRFGLSPADRVGLEVDGEKEDDFKNFLKNRGKQSG